MSRSECLTDRSNGLSAFLCQTGIPTYPVATVTGFPRRHSAKTSIYSFYVRPEGTPVRLHQIGNDLFSGSHFGSAPADPAAPFGRTRLHCLHPRTVLCRFYQLQPYAVSDILMIVVVVPIII